MEVILTNDDISDYLESNISKHKSTYDNLNAEIISIENMNIEFNFEIGDNRCTEDCPYKQFYLQTIGKKKNLTKFIEERNKVNKEILQAEELYNLYNNLLFIKKHIESYEHDYQIPVDIIMFYVLRII